MILKGKRARIAAVLVILALHIVIATVELRSYRISRGSYLSTVERTFQRNQSKRSLLGANCDVEKVLIVNAASLYIRNRRHVADYIKRTPEGCHVYSA